MLKKLALSFFVLGNLVWLNPCLASETNQSRGLESSSSTDEISWRVVPRAIFYVPNLLLKAVFYPPLKLIEWQEEYAIIEHVKDVLYNDERSIGLLPIVSYSSTRGWSAGARFIHKKIFGDWDEELEIKGVYNQSENYEWQISLSDQLIFGKPYFYEILLSTEAVPDQKFYGIGFAGEELDSGFPLPPRDLFSESIFSQKRDLIHLRGGYQFGENDDAALETAVVYSYNRRKTKNSAADEDSEPPIEQIFDTTDLVGFGETVETHEFFVDVIYDSVNPSGQPRTGWRTQAFVGGAPGGDYSFWHYGLEASKYTPLFYKNRVLFGRLALEGIDGPREKIPFTSLIRIGGSGRLRGYDHDAFRDEKMAIGTLEYHYPIHHSVLALLFVDSATLSQDVSDLGREWLTGYGFGFLVGSDEDLKLKIDFAFGEDNFEFLISSDFTTAFDSWSDKL